MEAFNASFFSSLHFSPTPNRLQKTQFLYFQLYSKPISFLQSIQRNTSRSKLFTTSSSSSTVSKDAIYPTDPVIENESQEEKFDWFCQWHPIMPVCDLDKRVPHGKRVMGLDVAVWWDRNENAWKVFDDSCPHRLAPLSEGRIDQWGRLQCVYHGWCFNGSGDCKFIPQAPPDGPPVHTFKKACVAAYPSTVQHGIVWFWPNSNPEYKDILSKKTPPYISELDDPSYIKPMANREFPYGYAKYDLQFPSYIIFSIKCNCCKDTLKLSYSKLDREGGAPMDINIEKLDINGYHSTRYGGASKFMAPCVYYSAFTLPASVNSGKTKDQGNGSVSSTVNSKERKIMEVGTSNWQKACYVPTKSDAQVIAFRKWLRKYSDGQINWGGRFSGALPPTAPKEQLMDRYWSHVVNCSSCNAAYKGLNALEVILQVVSIISIGIAAATKQSLKSAVARNALVLMAVLCFVASRWLAHFIYKNFHFHDYNHALV
ncbi:hypothetical protein JCGZ_01889 [Jatropha curcas]|uniref:Rieske domain-containing protein n=1 Tax=Jatropha curcas TaxID=180498 RepID=A0A067L0V6_JATCU|nr:hypothetical protein JCGZ_01889 [Jatropha curcas]